MRIRKCINSDVNYVYDLICELKNKEFDLDIFEKIYNKKIQDEKNYFIVAIEKNEVIGFLSVVIDYQLHHADKVATIEELIVKSKYRNNGVGKLLLNSAINYAKEKNCDVIELTSGFSRKTAHEFYEKNGFNKGSYKFKRNLK